MTLIILLLGLGVGVLVGLLGIGGGVVLVPAMVYLLGMDQHMAQGTSLFILLPPIGLGALREYWKQGQAWNAFWGVRRKPGGAAHAFAESDRVIWVLFGAVGDSVVEKSATGTHADGC